MSVGACSVCLRGRASCSLSVERGGRSTVVCLGFSWLWFLLGGRGARARGLPWLLGVGSTLFYFHDLILKLNKSKYASVAIQN